MTRLAFNCGRLEYDKASIGAGYYSAGSSSEVINRERLAAHIDEERHVCSQHPSLLSWDMNASDAAWTLLFQWNHQHLFSRVFAFTVNLHQRICTGIFSKLHVLLIHNSADLILNISFSAANRLTSGGCRRHLRSIVTRSTLRLHWSAGQTKT